MFVKKCWMQADFSIAMADSSYGSELYLFI